MFTSNIAQYISSRLENLSPMTNLETLYYEQAIKTDSSYVIVRQNMSKHMPVGYIVNNINDYTSINYDASLYQYEVSAGNYVNTYAIEKHNTSIHLNDGTYADTTGVANEHTLYSVDSDGYHCLNKYIKNYETKYDASNIYGEIYHYVDTSSYNAWRAANSSISFISGYVNALYSQTDDARRNIKYIAEDRSDKGETLYELEASIYAYGYNLIDADADNKKAKTSEPLNSYIYTHESIWQLMTHNMLIPGATYKMLYYPGYDVSLNISNYISYERSTMTNMIFTKTIGTKDTVVVNTTKGETYKKFPYILNLTAVNQCQVSHDVTFSDYCSEMTKYITKLVKVIPDLNNILIYPYNNVFQYNKLCPVILDIIISKEPVTSQNRCITVMYDHMYGYIFGYSDTVNDIFKKPFNNVYIFDDKHRYNIADNLIWQKIYDILIFKNNGRARNIVNSYISYTKYTDIFKYMQNNVGRNMIDITSLFVKSLQTSIKNWKIYNTVGTAYDNYEYVTANTKNSLHGVIDYHQWKAKYIFSTNSFTYLKDEYGNEGPYDFRNMLISKSSGTSSTFTGFTYNIANMTISGRQTIFDVSNYMEVDALMYQGIMKRYGNWLDYINHNKITYANFIMYESTLNDFLQNNNLEISKDIILYDSNNVYMKNCTNMCICETENSDFILSTNIIGHHCPQTYCNNMAVQTHLNVQYAPSKITVQMSSNDSNLLKECNNIKITNMDVNKFLISDSSYIDIENTVSTASQVYYTNMHNMKLFYNTAYVGSPAHMSHYIDSNTLAFDGSVMVASITKY